MAASYSTVKDFFEYLNDNNGKPWIECGLKDNAPTEAKEAYEKWVKEEKERIEQGIIL